MDGFQPGACPKPERADLITALEQKTAGAPRWIDDLAIAEKANIKPWEIEDMPAIWYERIKTLLIYQQQPEE